jgi:hypothetical protein
VIGFGEQDIRDIGTTKIFLVYFLFSK